MLAEWPNSDRTLDFGEILFFKMILITSFYYFTFAFSMLSIPAMMLLLPRPSVI